jgi:Ca2+/Na+ antiporter
MSRLIDFARATSEKPLEVIEGILGFASILTGLWFLSPYYIPSTSVGAEAWQSGFIPQVIGAVQAILALVFLFALFRTKLRGRRTIRRIMTFSFFVLYLFYAFTSTIILGLGRVSWINTFALAFIAGVAHLRLKWQEGENAGD